MSEVGALFRSHPIPSWVYSIRTLRFLAVNDAAIKAYGYSSDQFLSMTIDQIRPNEDRQRLQKHIMDGGCNESRSMWRHLRSDGSCIDVEIESSPIFFAGEAARLVAARNISGQTNNLEKLQLALSAGKFAVWECNIADKSLIWDPLHSGVYGIDRSLFPRNHEEFLALVDPEHRAMLQSAFERCVADGEPYDCVFRIAMPSLGVRWRHTIGKRVQDRAGTPVKVIGIGSDITEKKELEDKFHRSQNLETVGRLAAGISHDFNNILTVISGYSELIRSDVETELIEDAAREISAATNRAARLVKQLLDFSRSQPVSPQPIDIHRVFTDTLSLLSRLLPENICLVKEVAQEPVVLCADAGQIEQVVMNLCLNARDAMPNGGVLRCKLTATDNDVIILVADNGIGMNSEVRDKMFRPFFTTKDVGSGNGLGLSIVHGIVKQLGGSIDVRSAPGEGSTFTIKLPLTSKPSHADYLGEKIASQHTPE